jgi:lipoprotein-releasing system ATP-binding protein
LEKLTYLSWPLGPIGVSAENAPMANSADAKLIVSQVAKDFPTPGEPLQVLADVSFELSPGENLAILGPSGSGKSTLLSIVGTLEPPTSGSVTLDGQNPFTLNEADLAQFRSENVGFVFQEHYLLPQCTVLENVLVPFLADGAATELDRQHAERLLERVGLSGRLDHRPAELSGGERQRVAIARALVREPTLLLADEPTGNLDRSTAASITDLLLELQHEAETILIVVTHSTALSTALGRRMELDAGRLVPRE